MVYRDKAQAELERDMNERAIGGTWKISEWDKDGCRVYEPVRVCALCGERAHRTGQGC